MNQAKLLVVLYEQSHTRRYMVAALKDLKRRLQEERMREEHARLVRVRHYLTVSCLPPSPTPICVDSFVLTFAR
ncbi:Hypothetical protein PHPALM_5253, partial [Phytophthora palmivora]